MKALLRVLVLFFGITGIRTSSFADSGWFWQNPLPQGHRLFGVATSDPSTVIAVGDFGTILRTTDGGTTWTLQRSGSDNSLLAVCFVNADTGWAVGRRGTILHTIDGGATWVPQSSGTTDALFGCSFADANIGTAVGEHATILRTTDGGDSWVLQSSGTSASLSGITFADTNTGTAVGGSGVILRTTDGGDSWVLQFSGTTLPLSGVTFVDANTGWAVGGTILHTTDGGATWMSQGYGGVAVSFVDASTGWVVGGDIILHTADGGATWTRQSVPPLPFCNCGPPSLAGVSFGDANTGVAVGSCRYRPHFTCTDLGFLLHTTDGGDSWSLPLTGIAGNFLRAVSFADAQTAIAVGDFCDFSQPIPRCGGTILKTTDGGAFWTSQRVLSQRYYQVFLQGISYVDANTATVVGNDFQPVSGGGLILRTTDAGATWTRQSSGTTLPLYGVSFVDPNTGWAVGGTILHTTNGGATWTSQGYGGVAVSFVDTNTGWAVGGGGTILHTTTGGE